MILIDLNIYLYAADSSSPRHKEAVKFLEETVNSGSEEIGIPWVVHLGFIRLTTNPKVFSRPLTVEEACSWLDGLEALPSVTMVHPGKAHSGFLRHLLYSLGTGGNLVTDAHLAALALEQDATIATADRDFQRFPGLKVKIVF